MKKTFYGWYIVVAGFMITGACVGFYVNCLGAFVKPVSEALGFSRGEFTLYSTISMLSSMVTMPLYGELYRKVPMKKLLLWGGIACGLIPIGYSFSTQLWQFYVLAFINGTIINAASMMTVGTIINNWFKDKRGVAAGIAFSGSGLFAAIMVPVASKLIALFGWQWGYRALGIAGIAVVIPVVLFIIKDKPEDIGLSAYSENIVSDITIRYNPTGISRAEAFKTKTFWFLVLGVFLCGFTTMGMQPHTISYLTDVGYEYGFASTVVSVLMMSMIVGKLSLGYLFDKVGALKGALVGSTAAFLSAIFIILSENSIILVWLYAFAIGVACSTGSVAVNYLTSIYFGDKDFPRILPLITMAASFGIAIATPLSGAIYDLTGSYTPAWYMYLVTGLLEIVFFILAHRNAKNLTFSE